MNYSNVDGGIIPALLNEHILDADIVLMETEKYISMLSPDIWTWCGHLIGKRLNNGYANVVWVFIAERCINLLQISDNLWIFLNIEVNNNNVFVDFSLGLMWLMLNASPKCGWNYLSILKRQWFHCWSFAMDKWLHHTLCGWNYLSIPKRHPTVEVSKWISNYIPQFIMDVMTYAYCD